MNGKATIPAGTMRAVVRVRAGGTDAARQPSWLQARAPGLNARQRQQWRERLWACLSLAVLLAGWDISSRLDGHVAVSVLEATSTRA